MDHEWVRERFGIEAGDGLQTRTWRHNLDSSFRCVLCGTRDDMCYLSTTLFDGLEEIGDLCHECVEAGPARASLRAKERAVNLREWADDLTDLAAQLATLDLSRWSTVAERDLEEQQPLAGLDQDDGSEGFIRLLEQWSQERP